MKKSVIYVTILVVVLTTGNIDVFASPSDTEIITHLLAKPSHVSKPDPLAHVLNHLQGAYSLVFLFALYLLFSFKYLSQTSYSRLNISPYASLLQFGVGNVTMEVEIIDAGTGEQIGAVVETQKGSRIPFTNLGKWTTARKIMDGWGKRLKERLEEVR